MRHERPDPIPGTTNEFDNEPKTLINSGFENCFDVDGQRAFIIQDEAIDWIPGVAGLLI